LEKVCNSGEFEDEGLTFGVLEAMEIKPYSDCLNICFDGAGAVYEIPNYCINDPLEYDILSTTRGNIKKPVQKDIKVIIRKVVDEVSIACTNIWTVGELKNSIKAIGDIIEAKPECIRLFFGGKELQNAEELWNYNIEDGSIVALMYRQEILD
jgi:hypothetical protein